ncbi:hypothetical protein [Nocardioides zeicaulis]|uniref:Alpha/beta-hydrolase catalytic domain-containing protein n=1 Tax=Nocardioides zeicaulis TaxID=1776857 RepID=A0ABV6E6K4_9ACTN
METTSSTPRDTSGGTSGGTSSGAGTPEAARGWASDLATAAATGVVTTFLPMHRWSRRAQWSLHGGFGALASAATVLGLRIHGRDEDDAPPPVATVAALALGVGAVTALVSRGGQGLDTWAEHGLTARGVRRPRLWMGAAAATLSLAMSVVERRLDGPVASG